MSQVIDRSRNQLELMSKLFPEIKIILIEGKQYGELKVKYRKLIPTWEGK